MRGVILFDNKISKKTISKLIGSLELMFTEYDTVDLYFSSTGGDGFYCWLLIDYVNKNKEKINLVVYGNVFSAGVIFAAVAKCSKQFLPEIVLLIHKANIIDGNFKDIHKAHATSTWAIEKLNQTMNEEFLSHVICNLIPEEVSLYANGEDVYIIDQERIQKILTESCNECIIAG